MSGEKDRIAERVARNQATFRDANERIQIAAAAMAEEGPLPFICECMQRDCTQLTMLTLNQYEDVRRDGRRFLVVPGHEFCEVDGVEIAEVVARNESFSVMEKVGEAGELAAAVDPRRQET